MRAVRVENRQSMTAVALLHSCSSTETPVFSTTSALIRQLRHCPLTTLAGLVRIESSLRWGHWRLAHLEALSSSPHRHTMAQGDFGHAGPRGKCHGISNPRPRTHLAVLATTREGCQH